MRRLVDMIGLRRQDTQRPCVPDTVAVFAIGDLHGEIDLLVRMHQQILQQAKALPENMRKIVIYLGDYIDRGPDGAGVIDALVSAPLPGFKSVYLLGNHELAMISFIKGEADFLRWSQRQHESRDLSKQYLRQHHLVNWLYKEGGLETLKSYDVHTYSEPTPKNLNAMRIQLLRKIPTDHLTFYEQLQLNYAVGDFFFVHAGIDPSRPLNDQRPSDMLGIGDPFLSCKTIYDKVIVHGHTPFQSPSIQRNRIGLDTEAHKSGMLSGVMIKGDQITVLQAKSYT